jgi:UDP-GlcNAc:undecaprenyl-phosphate GlcNAc-1-phosphate transferase
VVNAFNLVDGMDGLAGLLAIIALLGTVFVSGFEHPASMIALITISSISAFLIFNFPVPANRDVRCFMGDAGSTLLGFIVVWVTIGISQGPERVVSPVIGLWFASLPSYDLFTCFVRRMINGYSPFRPGRDHFHHTLKRSGLAVRQVVAILSGMQLLYATIGISAHFIGIPDVYMFVSWSVLGVSQRWIMGKIALMWRIRHRRASQTGDTGKYARPGTF